MGKHKRVHEDKHYSKLSTKLEQQFAQFKNDNISNNNSMINLISKNIDKIKTHHENEILSLILKLICSKNINKLKTFYENDIYKYTILDLINNFNIDDKKKHLEWLLDNLPQLFSDICRKQFISLALYIVINFNKKFYIEINNGKIIDHCDLSYQGFPTYHELTCGLKKDWWIKGFDIYTKPTECVVCYETTLDNVKTCCNHIFCRDCLGGHLKTKVDCPYCRTSLECDRRGKHIDDNTRYFGNLEYNRDMFGFFGPVYRRHTDFNATNPTYRLSVPITQPYNANFDGDELNIFMSTSNSTQNGAVLTQRILDSFHRAGAQRNS